MNINNKILEIKDLRISFHTNNGTVKAVRGISLDLDKGETLAIVGESGSGKSVSAKAIMGLLAGNSIIENGEIIYDGKDLLKLSEDEFHNYRGKRLAMIFQDPLSSLNPIMKIGKQMTEAMVINGRAKQRDAKRDFNLRILNLHRFMDTEPGTAESVSIFKKIVAEGAKLNRDYTVCIDRANETISDIGDVLISIINSEPKKVAVEIRAIITEAGRTYNEYVVSKDSDLPRLLGDLKNELKVYKISGVKDRLMSLLVQVRVLLEAALQKPAPDFFAITCKSRAPDGYLDDFTACVEKAMKKSKAQSVEAKIKAVEILINGSRVLEGSLDKKACIETTERMAKAVEACIDLCAIKKDSWSYIFGSSMKAYVISYFNGIKKNVKERKRYERGTARYNKLISQGKPAVTPVPAVITDLDMLRQNMKTAIRRLIDNFNAEINERNSLGSEISGPMIISLLFEDAKGWLNKVTKRIASNKAVRVMKDVGIMEPRKRFRQYPFELSGGMRQRIVIAIALSSNPDILICDEPTTALDVTIQSQILELINSMKAKYNLSVIFITHNLGVVANMADKVAVMYAGKIVEYGLTEEIFHQPAHPYTWALLASMPDLDTKEKLDAIPGTPPNMIYPPIGDAFADRSKYAMKIDFEMQPPEFPISETHWAATWLLHPKAPKVEPPKIVTDRIERMKRYKTL